MRTLYRGMSGDDVRAWENFLVGFNQYSGIIVDGVFDDALFEETKVFQAFVGVENPDGVVGPKTLAKALEVGFNPLFDDRTGDDGPNWPPRPVEGPLSLSLRGQTFGNFAYKPSGIPSNPEAITIIDGWSSKHIVSVPTPQLSRLGVSKVPFHKLCAPQFSKTLKDWEDAGLFDRILSWGGSWAPRFIRGSRTTLSNHAWGTAFDINAEWNGLGAQPALKGKKGCVRELVEIAYENGFYWGGWFGSGRPDGMHFECYKLVK